MNLPASRTPSGNHVVAWARLPEQPVERWMRPFVRFLHVESASGIVLLACTVVALVLANSPWATIFAEIWQTPLRLSVGNFELNMPVLLWVNDGLMTIFFFVVGLEIKRELVAGELRDPKKAALPVMAALGGMVAPALIYFALQQGQPGERGWGIPMATDIAFVVGFLALLGPRVPFGLKILLLSLAIADDIGAVLVIAVFYSGNMAFSMLGAAALGFGLISIFNRIGVRRVPVYVVVGAGIWLAFLESGVHPTVAGVLLGLLTPASAWVGDRSLIDIAADVLNRLGGGAAGTRQQHHKVLLGQLELAAREATSPLERLETKLHPWVAFLIMPVFALANAGVSIQPAAITNVVALAVAAGLILGKPLGIVAFSWLAVRIGLARMPAGVNWKIMIGAGSLAGIGFTMSLFIAGLALDGPLLDAGKIGTLTGSAVSAVLGSILLMIFLPGGAPIAASVDQAAVRPTPKEAEASHVD
jgi:Na+:H+ antiporter, NhaA family